MNLFEYHSLKIKENGENHISIILFRQLEGCIVFNHSNSLVRTFGSGGRAKVDSNERIFPPINVDVMGIGRWMA
jgi:hypothetical protein